MTLSDILPDPDLVGQAEYRAIYELLDSALHDMAVENGGYDEAEKFAHLQSILNEFIAHAESMKRRLKVVQRRM